MSTSPHELEMLSRQLNQAHRAALHAQLSTCGLTEIGHPMLLSILGSAGDCPEYQAQRELATMLHISPASVANSLKSLEKGGYIQRKPGSDDARRNCVLLTDKGREAFAQCKQALDHVSAQMLDGFSQAERAQLVTFRTRMLRNLLQAAGQPTQVKEEP